MSQYALLIDYKYCTGCHVCEVSCRKEEQSAVYCPMKLPNWL